MANYPYNYNPYNNYMQDLQNMRDRIDKTMQQYQNQNTPQQPQIHQNFQIAPVQQSELEAKYVNNIDDVKNTFVMREGVFINRDLSTLWIKNISGEIKTYTLAEVIETDPKDVEISELKNEIASLRDLLSQKVVHVKEDNKPETVKTERKSK